MEKQLNMFYVIWSHVSIITNMYVKKTEEYVTHVLHIREENLIPKHG